MKLYQIKDDYIRYISDFDKNVLSNHEKDRIFGRPYIGIVIKFSKMNYFIPLSSPTNKDYDASGNIRHNTTTIKRIISDNQLLGKIRINNMVPVPESEIIPIDLNKNNKIQKEINYIHLLNKQRIFLKSIQKEIDRDANAVYRQKLKEKDTAYWKNNKVPGYLDSTVNFLVLEEKCKEWITTKEETKNHFLNEKNLILAIQKIRYGKEKSDTLIDQKFECQEGKFQILELRPDKNARITALLQEMETEKKYLDENFASNKHLKLNLKEIKGENKNSFTLISAGKIK